MKRIADFSRLLLLSLCLVPFGALSAQDEDNDKGIVVYTDHWADFNFFKPKESQKSPRRAPRNAPGDDFYEFTAVSRKGKFVARGEECYFTNDYMLQGLMHAMSIWEDAIEIEVPIRFYIRGTEELDDEVVFQSRIAYHRAANRQAVPTSLFRQQTGDSEEIADTLLLNLNPDLYWWDGELTQSNTDSIHLIATEVFMRHIAYMLGFGTSVVQTSGGGLRFAVSTCPSPFDALVTDGTRVLGSMRTANTATLSAFFSRDLSLRHGTLFDYPLYNWGQYVSGKSGRFFHLGHDNLLEYNPETMNTLHRLCPEALDVVGAIGWTVHRHDAVIECDELSNIGYGTVYNTLTFKAKDAATGQPLSGQWECQAFNPATLGYSTVETCNGAELVVDRRIVETALDTCGCLQYRIAFTSEYNASCFPILLDARPVIHDMIFSNYVDVDDSYYTFDVQVIQEGATFGEFWFYCSGVTHSRRALWYDGPTHSPMNYRKGRSGTVFIGLANEYGYAKGRSYFVPSGYSNANNIYATDVSDNAISSPYSITTAGNDIIINGNSALSVKIISTDGRKVLQINSSNHVATSLTQGMYIVIITDLSNNQITNHKIHIK